MQAVEPKARARRGECIEPKLCDTRLGPKRTCDSLQSKRSLRSTPIRESQIKRSEPIGLDLWLPLLDLNSALLRACGSRTRILQAKFYPVAQARRLSLCLRFNKREKKKTESVWTLFPFWVRRMKVQLLNNEEKALRGLFYYFKDTQRRCSADSSIASRTRCP